MTLTRIRPLADVLKLALQGLPETKVNPARIPVELKRLATAEEWAVWTDAEFERALRDPRTWRKADAATTKCGDTDRAIQLRLPFDEV